MDGRNEAEGGRVVEGRCTSGGGANCIDKIWGMKTIKRDSDKAAE